MITWMEPSWKWDPGCEIWGVNYQNEAIYNGLPFWYGFPCCGAMWDFIGWSTLLHAALSAGGLVSPYWTISRTTKWETAAVPQWWWPTISLANVYHFSVLGRTNCSIATSSPTHTSHHHDWTTVPRPECPSDVAKDSGTTCDLGINYFKQHHH